MNVFLTGASGYVGKHVAQELHRRGHKVIGLARKPSARTRCLPDVEWCFAELSDFDAYWHVLLKSDAVIHCAMDYTSFGAENSELDRTFASRMSEFQGQFIYTGNLFSDRTEGTIEESLKAHSNHWRYQTEVVVLGASNLASVIRLGFVYGGSGGYFWEILSPGTLAQLKSGSVPEVTWPMVHVKDVARLYASVIESSETGVFHACDGTISQANDIVESARSIYAAQDISSSEVHDYIQGLLQTSIVTSNKRSLSTGWRPVVSSFVDNAMMAYSESITESNNQE